MGNLDRLGQNQGIDIAGLNALLSGTNVNAQRNTFYDPAAIALNRTFELEERLLRVENRADADDEQQGVPRVARVPAPSRSLLQKIVGSPTGHAVSRGWNQAVFTVSVQSFGELLKSIPDSMKKLSTFLAAYAYKLSFGSHGLTWNGLAKINNRIHTLCLPLTGAAAQTRDRQRRADLIGAEQTGVTFTEHNWQVFQAYLLRELQHAQEYLKQALPCYDLTFLDTAPKGLKIKLARFIQACSLQDNRQVSFYSTQALNCLAQLKKLVQEFKSLDQAQQNHEQTKRWLSLTCNTFEQIALILEGENTQRQPGRLVFSRLSAQSQSTMPTLDALLGGVLPPGASAN